MDRRQKKTREAIFKALSALLEKKKYNHITVQDIIDQADIGRTTFYAHFDTKDALLEAMCTDIFTHVFSEELSCEKTHDFSGNHSGLKARLTHILYHLQDSRTDITGILSCESGELFMDYFKKYLSEMFQKYPGILHSEAPVPFQLYYLSGSFAETVRWWISEKNGAHAGRSRGIFYFHGQNVRLLFYHPSQSGSFVFSISPSSASERDCDTPLPLPVLPECVIAGCILPHGPTGMVRPF